MARTRIKICGITRPEDAALAAELGADAIGLNFVGGPRRIEVARAGEIVDVLPAMVLPVALVGYDGEMTPQDFLEHGVRRTPIFTFQLYDNDPDLSKFDSYPERFAWWWVAHVADRQSLAKLAARFKEFDRCPPAAILLDTASLGKLGGTGQSFNWQWIAEAREAGELAGLPSIILAGGLKPENVGEAIRVARPYAVDVSSGVEVAGKPGVKDAVKVRDFIQAVQGA